MCSNMFVFQWVATTFLGLATGTISNFNNTKIKLFVFSVIGYPWFSDIFGGVITPGHHHEHPCLTVYNGGPRDGWWLRGSVVPCNEKPGLPWLFSVFLGDEILASFVGILLTMKFMK